MSGATFEAWRQLAAVWEVVAILITGVVIKLMDDCLDKEFDRCCGQETLASRWNEKVLPYALLLLAVAVNINPGQSLSLFLGAYVIGMARDPDRRLPIGLSPAQESVLALLLGIGLCGWREQISSLLAMAFIQAADDLADAAEDAKTGVGRLNLVSRWGRTETVLVAVICCLSACLMDWRKTLAVIFCTPVVLGLLRLNPAPGIRSGGGAGAPPSGEYPSGRVIAGD